MATQQQNAQNIIKNKVCLVTGATGSIGKAIVEGFLKAGASKVYAAGRDIECLANVDFDGDRSTTTTTTTTTAAAAAAAATDDINSHDDDSRRVLPLYADLSQPFSIYEAAKVASDVQILVNSAGILHRITDPLSDGAVEKLQEEIEINVYGLMHISKAFEDILEKNSVTNTSSEKCCGSCFFVQLNSAASLRCSSPTVSTYSASKAASFSMTQALKQTWINKKKNIHVISVMPGPIAGRMTANLGTLSDLAEPPSVVADAIIQAINNSSSRSAPPFLIFPDKMSQKLGEEYASYAQKVIEDGKVYGNFEASKK
jgi:NAD(P)-dependent dehydrogenase (short-subunit alcohol dehydrogenase family)